MNSAGCDAAPMGTTLRSGEHSRLESLPPEIRRLILLRLDLPQLKALVSAAPTFHEQYLYDRKYILCRSLERSLGSATVDAYAVHLFATLRANKSVNVSSFLRSYSESMARRWQPLADKITEDEVISMVAFYFRYVEAVIADFVRWILNNLAVIGNLGCRILTASSIYDDEVKITQLVESYRARELVTLTPTETTRFIRTLYRFQLFCQLGSLGDSDINGLPEENVQALIDVFEPWERDELYSFYLFVDLIYTGVFNSIGRDIRPGHSRFDSQEGPLTSDGALDRDLDFPTFLARYWEGTALHGLSLLHAVLFTLKDHEELVVTMQRHLTKSSSRLVGYEGCMLDGIIGPEYQEYRSQEFPTERDRMQQERAPLPFRGDGDPAAPPLGWTIIWKDTYSNLFGYYTGDSLMLIGYVFWDAATLEDIGGRNAKKLIPTLELEWREDPRNWRPLGSTD